MNQINVRIALKQIECLREYILSIFYLPKRSRRIHNQKPTTNELTLKMQIHNLIYYKRRNGSVNVNETIGLSDTRCAP